jgi:hypothetical protein
MDHTTILYGCRKIQSILNDVNHKEFGVVTGLINRVEVDLGLSGKSAVVHWVHPRNKRGEI